MVEGGRLLSKLGEIAFLPMEIGPEYRMCLCGEKIQTVRRVIVGENAQLEEYEPQGQRIEGVEA